MPVTDPRDRRGGKAGGARAGLRLWVAGVVQGVGFRPYVYNLAARCGVAGWVRNTSAGVEIEVEGAPAEVAAFRAALPRETPPRAFVASLRDEEVAPSGADGFRILESLAEPGAYQLVSPDIALCDDCRREILDPGDRRYRYPFTNCTNCGPRFTVIEELPYDRAFTTMRAFEMCPDCRREYEDPGDRRFHAEPNACPVCGPQVTLLRAVSGGGEQGEAGGGDAAGDGDGEGAGPTGPGETVAAGGYEPIALAARALREGAIVAIKGLGGFHLACDATSEAAVLALKERKRRPDKPLAVMFADVDQTRRHCLVTPEEQALLESVEHPIVLVEWRAQTGDPSGGKELGAGEPGEAGAGDGEKGGEGEAPVSAEVAVRQRYLGAMLPYTPLHLLLLEAADRPLVMTSGNLAEEPIVKDLEEAGRLARIPDLYLVHDRAIAARYDDSVALVRRGAPRLVRRSRGYAPFPLALPRSLPQVLACGAELKNSFCLTRDANAFVSQHIGDLENLETLEHFETSIELYRRLFRLRPEAVAYDLHPEYLATKYALALPAEGEGSGGAGMAGAGGPLEKIGVQHHHAHVVACMAEHGREVPVIGVSMDGLGYGADGALWGGEVLVCDPFGFRRAAHLEYLPLAGGALAVERPARTAAGWLLTLLGPEDLERARRVGLAIGDDEAAVVARQVETGVNAPLTSSCGRLFDAVSAMAGLRSAVTYEGQAAIELEMVSAPGAEPYAYEVDERAGAAPPEVADGPALVRLAPLFAGVLADLEAGCGAGHVGSRLHATLAVLVLDLCRRVRAAEGLEVAALSGGVFQNRLLTELCEGALERDGFTVLTHAAVPPNDGGLSLGQAMVAGYTLLRNRGLLD